MALAMIFCEKCGLKSDRFIVDVPAASAAVLQFTPNKPQRSLHDDDLRLIGYRQASNRKLVPVLRTTVG
jgi:hypothetical protein